MYRYINRVTYQSHTNIDLSFLLFSFISMVLSENINSNPPFCVRPGAPDQHPPGDMSRFFATGSDSESEESSSADEITPKASGPNFRQ